jgi:Cu/Ag efflux protein CusF
MRHLRLPFGLIAMVAICAVGMARLTAVADDAPNSREPGGTAIIGAAGTATVKSIDADKRIVTLQTPDGDLIAVKCGKEARNFDQIQVGDQVRAVAIAKLVVSVRTEAGPGPKPEAGVILARSPKGAKPGAILASTEEMTAKIESVDADKQTVTLKAQAAEPQTIKVAPDVDLAKVKPGDEVMAKVTKGVALWVTGPEGARPAAERIKPEAEEGEPFVLDAATATATVEAVDPAKRMVTLKTSAGATKAIHLGPECVNFDQIMVGDQVRTTVAEEVAISIRKAGEEPAPGEVAGTLVTLAPKGAKPGMFITDTDVITAKVKSIDTAKDTITLTETDGGSRTVKAGPDVKLSELKEGDEITARVTQAMAIVVQKPE